MTRTRRPLRAPRAAGVPLFAPGAPVRLGIDPRQLRLLTA